MHLITSLVDALWVSTRYNAGRLLVLMGTQHTANRLKSKPLHASLQSSYTSADWLPHHSIIISRMHFIMCSSYPGGFVYVSLHILTGHYSQSTQKIRIICTHKYHQRESEYISLRYCHYVFFHKEDEKIHRFPLHIARTVSVLHWWVRVVCAGTCPTYLAPHACMFFLHENFIILLVNIGFVKYM